jgi:hypothetical protein
MQTWKLAGQRAVEGLDFGGCDCHPGTGLLHPVTIERRRR